MRILKKTLLLMIFSVIFSSVLLCQKGSAITLVPTNQDFYYERNVIDDPSIWTYSSTGDVYAKACYCDPGSPHFNTAIPYFNFDMNPYMSVFNSSSYIKLNLLTSTLGIQTPTAPKPATFMVYLTDWSSTPATITTAKISNIVPIAATGTTLGEVILTSVYGADQLLQITLDKSSISSYLATHSNQLKLLIDPNQVLTPGQTLTADFYGLPSGNAAQLELEGEVPIPEPSSMILGLIGLGGMLGFRRKNRGELS